MSHFPNSDAVVDCEMLVSDFQDDGSAIRKRSIMPKASLLISGILEHGETATAAETCGDGGR